MNLVENNLEYKDIFNLANNMKFLSNNVTHLDLNLCRNNLGGNKENMKQIGNTIKYLLNIQHLTLNLSYNRIVIEDL